MFTLSLEGLDPISPKRKLNRDSERSAAPSAASLKLSSRPERPDSLFRAELWRVGPRSGGIVAQSQAIKSPAAPSRTPVIPNGVRGVRNLSIATVRYWVRDPHEDGRKKEAVRRADPPFANSAKARPAAIVSPFKAVPP